MDTKPKATIDSLINKDFRYKFQSYKKGEIFERNPNKRSHNSLKRSGRISDFDESKYEYVCCKYNAVIRGESYKLLDIVPQDKLDIGMADILVKRKAISKRLKGFAQKHKELIQEQKQINENTLSNTYFDGDINLTQNGTGKTVIEEPTSVEAELEPEQEVKVSTEDYTDFNIPSEMSVIDFLMSLRNQQVAKDVLKIDVNSLRDIIRDGGAEDYTTPSGFTYKAQMKRSHAEIVKNHIDSLKAATEEG